MTTLFTPDFYEMYDEDFEAFARGEFNVVEDEDGNVDEDEVVANWRKGEEAFEAIEEVEREDAHLEGMYEDMQCQWDFDPSPYEGMYSEM